ncbi:MAG TPA: RdgB/HAM1 family non-canonical purine NTP pyrophosphatase [Terriglobales bacterium]|nr:RdgB/HAM1 family non-canonical purine NTP pyrophosphatase [Terriglobales bacterium]
MGRVLIATSNPGKLRDFAGAAAESDIEVAAIPDFSSLPTIVEDGPTFEANARAKAEHYSRYVPGDLVLADDSGLEVEALGGAPGVRSARYSGESATDELNNVRLLQELEGVPDDRRSARFVCVIAVARDGRTLDTFQGEAAGVILCEALGSGGFGYDPLFFFPPLRKTFAQLSPEEKAKVSHRGAAFRSFLDWYGRDAER